MGGAGGPGDAGVDPAEVNETILGQARQAGAGPNPARQVSMGAGIPETRPAMTVNQACGSGLTTLLMARDRIRLGEAEVVAAIRLESAGSAFSGRPGHAGRRSESSGVADCDGARSDAARLCPAANGNGSTASDADRVDERSAGFRCLGIHRSVWGTVRDGSTCRIRPGSVRRNAVRQRTAIDARQSNVICESGDGATPVAIAQPTGAFTGSCV